MPECPLADDCPSYSEVIDGMGCQHYGDRAGAEWCQHYNMPINELKQQPVKPGEELIVEVSDIHESGAGVGRTEDGFIVLVDGILPDARARVRIDRVSDNHATADPVERLPMDPDEEDAADGETAEDDAGRGGSNGGSTEDRAALGSRDNFWGG